MIDEGIVLILLRDIETVSERKKERESERERERQTDRQRQ